mmetsp:Transcript_53678/g.117365  ORF Transcript_53678/g.117365 Transcript_53678/m.117365 type:complete len:338 (-) Transcript_53678:1294-2307(-)
MAAEGSLRVGTVQQVESTLGYIEPDTGEEPAAVLPNACVGFDFTIPPVRTRVVYRQSTQQEDGSHETLAADVFPEDHDFLGTIDKDNGTFGFIQVDGKDDRVFVMPIACSAFGGRIPPLQTPVKFKVVMDNKTGRPRADFVRPQFGAEAGPERQSVKREQPDVQRAPGEVYTGQVSRVKGNFGFIQPDDSSDEIFFMPRGFKASHGMPPRGMRVGFQIVMDEKTGRPRADNIYPEAGQGVPVAPAEILRIGDPPTNVMGSPGGIGGIGGIPCGWPWRRRNCYVARERSASGLHPPSLPTWEVKRSRSPWVQWRCNRALAATAVCCTVRSFAMESGAL